LDTELLRLLSAIGAAIVTTGSLAVWINGQFAKIGRFIMEQTDKMLNKLEYHERHDDERFADVTKRFDAVSKNLYEIRISNAARSGKINGDHN
jgi:capsule polysaccharide export protein KpsE/RkpR